MSQGDFTARDFVVYEANLAQLKKLRPNVAVLPWAATEAHNYHLPHGTDAIEASCLAETAVKLANEQGARCAMLPCIPYGNDNLQLTQVITITMRSSTQQAMLKDVADSLVKQGIDRLVILNFHGGNDFKQMIRDVMMDAPIFIVQVNGYAVSAAAMAMMQDKGDHAGEYETSLLMHLTPQWVAPLETAGDGTVTPSKLPAITSTPGVWAPRDWAAVTKDTGIGNPIAATADKGRRAFDLMVSAVVPVLAQLSAASNGDFPFVVHTK